MEKKPFSSQLRLFDAENVLRMRAGRRCWPAGERMPLNAGDRTVAATVLNDLRRSRNPMIVTGYSSLAFLIEQLPCMEHPELKQIRLLIGNEPKDQPVPLTVRAVPEQMREYWLARGISVRQSLKLMACLRMLREGKIRVRTLDMLHAKIHLADDAITIGSSNFSRAGFSTMLEGNVRFSRIRDKARYREACQVAGHFWDMGRDFTEDFLHFLEQLLRKVSFGEAVARACSELLEGHWAGEAMRGLDSMESVNLWPSQKHGIARALWILENEGSVLIADATGAGKTRMGCGLLKALQQRLWQCGRMSSGLFLLIAPQGVRRHWEHERARAGLNMQIHSDGVISSTAAIRHEEALRDIRHAQCLAVDEAHHFLNRSSQRTRRMLGNLAEHVVLFTATPINRGVRDILSLVDLLGADNLDDNSLKFFDELERRLRRAGSAFALTPTERAHLQRLLGRFTLRRTKRDLRQEIESSPEAYRDESGRTCRYPEHRSHVYPLGETGEDRKLAQRIRELAGNLRGMIQFQGEIRMPPGYRKGVHDYVRTRLKVANALVVYRIMAALRSSRAALTEHLYGTGHACGIFGIQQQFKGEDTGNEIGRLRSLAGRPPPCPFSGALPDWLRKPEAHRQAVEEEIAILEQIGKLAQAMSDRRDRARAERIAQLHETHAHLLAFNSKLISLALMQSLLKRLLPDIPILMATGSADSDRGKIEHYFSLHAKQPAIGLCSDALSEGVNLQQASALVLLDLPSVIRIAEQRIGRVDRLNSPHDVVDIYWPDDAPEFALQTDRKFVHRHLDVGALLGANIEVPDELMGEALTSGLNVPDSARAMMVAIDADRLKPFEGVSDAFAPVRALVNGPDAIVSRDVYETMRHVHTHPQSLIAMVKSDEPWAFFAISGIWHGQQRGWAPRWVWLDGKGKEPVTDMAVIADHLRAVHERGVHDLDSLEESTIMENALREFTSRLDQAERQLLPRRRRRALNQMEEVLRHWSRNTSRAGTARQLLDAILSPPADDGESIHWHALADAWIMATADVWIQAMQQRRKPGPLRLKDITPLLKDSTLPPEKMESLYQSLERMPPASSRTVVTIVAIPGA